MSTTDTIGAFCDTQAPGSTLRLPTKPSTGEMILVLPRLICSSSSRASVCCDLRLGEVDLRLCGHVARLGVVERLLGEELPLEEVLRAVEVEFAPP